jgi:hypothetical protein
MTDPGNDGQKRRRRSSIIIPSVLILLGILLLLHNFGLIHWNVWVAIARFWPLILIALGLELILGRGSVSRSIVIVIVFIIIFGLAVRHPTARGAITRTRVEKPLSRITSAEIEINMGVGALYLSSLPDSSDLISGTVDTAVGEWLKQDFNITADSARLVLSTENNGFFTDFNFFGLGAQPARKWDLAVSESIPISLDIRTGVGEARINLERVLATDVEIRTGVGKTDLTLPAAGHSRVTLSGGIGETIIHIPEGVAARIRTKTGIGSVQVYGNYTRSNNEHISPDFNTADNRVDLEVKGGIGSIRIQG